MKSPFQPRKPVVIGLLGAIAGGKSAVAALLGERGLLVIDADQKARQAVEDPAVARGIRRRFGAAVFDAGGRLDRQALAAIVFADAGARRDLEALTHPVVRRAVVARLEQSLAAGKSVVLDVPLLLEGGLIDRCDVTVFVEAREAVRLQRAAARGWDAAELHRRQATQADLEVKKRTGTYTIDNSGSLQHTREQVDAILARLSSPAERDR